MIELLNLMQKLPKELNEIIFEYSREYTFLDEYFKRLKIGKELNNGALREIKAIQLLGVLTNIATPSLEYLALAFRTFGNSNGSYEAIWWRETNTGLKRSVSSWSPTSNKKVCYTI